jgi:hypothetical protein
MDYFLEDKIEAPKEKTLLFELEEDLYHYECDDELDGDCGCDEVLYNHY